MLQKLTTAILLRKRYEMEITQETCNFKETEEICDFGEKYLKVRNK